MKAKMDRSRFKLISRVARRTKYKYIFLDYSPIFYRYWIPNNSKNSRLINSIIYKEACLFRRINDITADTSSYNIYDSMSKFVGRCDYFKLEFKDENGNDKPVSDMTDKEVLLCYKSIIKYTDEFINVTLGIGKSFLVIEYGGVKICLEDKDGNSCSYVDISYVTDKVSLSVEEMASANFTAKEIIVGVYREIQRVGVDNALVLSKMHALSYAGGYNRVRLINIGYASDYYRSAKIPSMSMREAADNLGLEKFDYDTFVDEINKSNINWSDVNEN